MTRIDRDPYRHKTSFVLVEPRSKAFATYHAYNLTIYKWQVTIQMLSKGISGYIFIRKLIFRAKGLIRHMMASDAV